MTTHYALIIKGRAIMGVGDSPEEAIRDAKYDHETCKDIPDNPNDVFYRGSRTDGGHTDGEYMIDVLPTGAYKWVLEHGTGTELSWAYLLGWMEGRYMRLVEDGI